MKETRCVSAQHGNGGINATESLLGWIDCGRVSGHGEMTGIRQQQLSSTYELMQVCVRVLKARLNILLVHRNSLPSNNSLALLPST
jgi:hypothetical protein